MTVADRWAQFRGLSFMPSRVPALDALVTFIADGQPIRPVVQRMLDRVGSHRWFPAEGGHELLLPHEGGQYDHEVFKVRPKAWDHEICSSCRARVPAMTPCWVTDNGPFRLLCGTCKAELDAVDEKGR